MTSKFYRRLRRILRERNISYRALANTLMVSKCYISDMCAGKKEPKLSLIIEICKLLDESADYLLGLKD